MKLRDEAIIKENDKNLKILAISCVIGILAGTVSVLYRIVLMNAEVYTFAFYGFLRSNIKFFPVALVILALGGLLLGWVTGKYPLIAGSGIPQVKGRILGHLKNNWLTTLIFKFFGGAFAVLAGLSLGREGPSIHLGACVAEGVAKNIRTTKSEKRIYIAAGASAGLAAAFNAPLAGVIFVIEEIFRYISPMILLTTMVSAVIADFISSSIFGLEPVFNFQITKIIALEQYWVLIVLGIVLGICGTIYNVCLLKTQGIYKKIKNAKIRPIIPFVLAGFLGIFFPVVLCGGHAITEELNMYTGITMLCLMLFFKFLFSIISFGSGVPGGIFFPLLILGATIGAIFGKVAIDVLGFSEPLLYNFIVLAMAGYFAAIVRAPITGIILLLEMTGSFELLFPLIVTSVIAYIVAEELGSKPIYDSLLENLLKNMGKEDEVEDEGKILVEAIIHHGSYMENKLIRDMILPEKTLIVSVRRGRKEITPNGNTEIKAGDHIYVLTDLSKEIELREALAELTIR